MLKKVHEEYEHLRELAKTLEIPSCPQIVIDVYNEVRSKDTDFRKVIDLVSKDVGLSAKVLKVSNRPMFGAGRVDSIEKAINMLGINTFSTTVLASALNESMCSAATTVHFEKFWRHSEVVAALSAHIAKTTRSIDVNMAYMCGLFHDSAVAIFVKKKYPDYTKLIDQALGIVPAIALSGKKKSIIGLEEAIYNTNHCVVSFLMAKTWHLPEVVAEAVCYHHYVDVSIHERQDTRTLAAILLLAEYLREGYDNVRAVGFYKDLQAWIKMHPKVPTQLYMSAEDIQDLKRDALDIINAV
ncbi:HDOD domain-containing protein [Candidatus Magnetobacterium casense]|uniref:HDOD domain-containing protein n=1 Tax=Candidatus Magnetobacterium casense TaxID=1455061 RepID=UPI00058AEBA0|nr:HDOD domain-containing protein [Candidatus Magnetobacterium casensis]